MPNYQWIDDASSLNNLIDELTDEDVYGIDTEFHRERTYFAKLALVQLSWREGIALVDPLATPIAPLKRLLDSDALCLIHAPSQDLEILETECGTIPSTIFDTQTAGLFLGLGTASLAKLIDHFLGIQLDKGAQMTDWMARPLGKRPLDYAASDVAYLLELKDAMSPKLEEAGRSGWAADEMEQLRSKDRKPGPPEEAWWKLRGKGKISGRSQGIAQALAGWRDETARRTDRPVRHVLSDVALVSLIQQPPKNKDALMRTRGIDKRNAPNVDEILQAIAQGRNLPAPEIRRPPVSRGSVPKALASLCLAYLHQRAEDEKIDSGALGTRTDVEMLVTEESGRLMKGWRHELIGAELQQIVRGEKAIVARASGQLVAVPNPKE